ncbi:MAG: hypothetical protein GXP44_00510 [bacterium]|nr:hypothetical protein [bacterium]
MERKILKPSEYPAGLREIPKVPEEMYLIGELQDPAEYIYLAVVGTRKFSGYGKEACEKIIGGLKGCPIVIVSGLALGIDAIAHRAALDAGLKTVAIPGSGLDFSVLHPRTNHRLAKEIVELKAAALYCPNLTGRNPPASTPFRKETGLSPAYRAPLLSLRRRSGAGP